jgi:hypothetical protein
MAIKITVINNVDVPKNVRKMNDDALWTFAANEWHRLISPFTPMDTGQQFILELLEQIISPDLQQERHRQEGYIYDKFY